MLLPKPDPAFGWTPNFAHRAAWAWLALLLGVPLAAVVAEVACSTR